MERLIPPQDFAFYADESGISQDRFTVVGGLCMRAATARQVYGSIREFRAHHGMNAEMKWSKVSNQKLVQYRAFVDLFFALNNTNRIQFHCVAFDSHLWNHTRYNDGDADIGLSKLYYNLILHKFVRRCAEHGSLFVCLDRRTSSTPLIDLRNIVNSVACRDFGFDASPLKQVISRDSKLDDILQMNDVILGAVCAARNGKHLLAGGREAKRVLARDVLEKSGLTTLEDSSPKHINRFTCWNFRALPR